MSRFCTENREMPLFAQNKDYPGRPWNAQNEQVFMKKAQGCGLSKIPMYIKINRKENEGAMEIKSPTDKGKSMKEKSKYEFVHRINFEHNFLLENEVKQKSFLTQL